jgi:hypothetical protein
LTNESKILDGAPRENGGGSGGRSTKSVKEWKSIGAKGEVERRVVICNAEMLEGGGVGEKRDDVCGIRLNAFCIICTERTETESWERTKKDSTFNGMHILPWQGCEVSGPEEKVEIL